MIEQLRLRQRVTELKLGFMFLTRLPLAHDAPVAKGELAQALWAAPLVGIVIGLAGAITVSVVLAVHVQWLQATGVAVAVTTDMDRRVEEAALPDVVAEFGRRATGARLVRW